MSKLIAIPRRSVSKPGARAFAAAGAGFVDHRELSRKRVEFRYVPFSSSTALRTTRGFGVDLTLSR